MKLNVFFKFYVFVSILFSISCTNGENEQLSETNFGHSSTLIIKMAPIIDSQVTRAGISGTTSVWKLYFDNGVDAVDTMGLFPNGGYQIPFEVPIPKGTTASDVLVTAAGWSTKKNITYGIYLPYNFYNRDYSKIPWDLRSVPKQKSNTDMVPAGLRMLLASDTCQSTSGATGDTLKTSIFMKGSILQVRCKMTISGSKYVKMMLASSDANQFTLYGTLNMFKNTTDSYSKSLYGVNQEFTEIVHSDHISVLLDSAEINSSGYVVGYFTTPPCSFTGKTITAYLWDAQGNVYAGPRVFTGATVLSRHSFINFNFPTMTLYTGATPLLNPWEKTEDICPTCTPVAF